MAETRDPFQTLREWLDRGERELNELISSRSAEPRANALRGRLSNRSLDATKRMRGLWESYFHSMNLPTRGDVIRLGKRIDEVERTLARIEGLLREGSRPAAAESSAAPSRPRVPRTRRPPSEAPKPRSEGAAS